MTTLNICNISYMFVLENVFSESMPVAHWHAFFSQYFGCPSRDARMEEKSEKWDEWRQLLREAKARKGL